MAPSFSIDALLARPVEEGVRLQALALLEALRSERARLDQPGDDEAVHDFRVALRRLRSLLKSHRPHLSGKVEKVRKMLGDVAELTTEARDAEVQLAWLGEQKLPTTRRPALVWLKARLEERKQHGYTAARTAAVQALDALLSKAEKRLGRFERDVTAAAGESALGPALASLLIENAEGLARRLAEVASATDETTAHEARILGKQLRYLLEPLVDSEAVGADAKKAVKDLKELQDILGELHDAHVLGHVVEQAMVDAAAERARLLGAAVLGGPPAAGTRKPRAPRDLRPGLVTVAGKVRDRRDRQFKALVEHRPTVDTLVGEVIALAGRLGAGAGVEIERKYLLRGMPEVEGAEVFQIEQGWIAGERLKERLRRMSGPDGQVRLIRGMKLGAGIRRTEVEEDCPADLFEKLWPLTAGHRIVKQRYKVPDGDLTWEIDRFTDRDLFLAEVELPSETTEVKPPAWLAPLIVREVTGVRAYTNEALASAKPSRIVKAVRKRKSPH